MADRGACRETRVILGGVLVYGLVMVYGLALMAGLWMTLTDPDSFTRAYMARLMLEGQWFDHTLPGIDPPHGLVTHWTNPMTLLVVLGSLPLLPFMDARDAIVLWGQFLSPLLFCGLILSAYWAVRGVGDRNAALVATFIVASMSYMQMRFIPGIIDHSSLIYPLWLVVIGYALRILVDPTDRRTAFIGGLVTALAILVSVELVLLVIALNILLAGCFVCGDRRAATAGLAYASALCLGAIALLLVEYGPFVLAQAANETDTLSGFFVIGFGFAALGWGGAVAIERRIADHKLVVLAAGILGAALCAGLWAMVGWLQSQLVEAGQVHGLDPIYRQTRSLHISESDSLFRLRHFWRNSPEAWTALLDRMPVTVLGILALATMLVVDALSRSRRTLAWLFLLLTLTLVTRGYTSIHLRSIPFFEMTSAVALAVALALAVGRLVSPVRPLHVVLVGLVCALIGLADLGRLVSGLLPAREREPAMETTLAPPAPRERGYCDSDDAIQHLRFVEPASSRDAVVLGFADFGPDLLAMTDYGVLSIPNHRNQPGYRLTYDFFHTEDLEAAERMLRQRGVTHVIFCGRRAFAGFEGRHEEGLTLGRLLDTGIVPQFLEEVPLSGRDWQARLLRVRPEGGAR